MTQNPDRRNPQLGDDLVRIGEVVKPHGIRGEIKVYSYSQQPENFKHYTEVVLLAEAGSRTEIYKIAETRKQGKLAILQLEGVTTREAAAALQGNMVCVQKADFPKPASDEFYWHQLEGLQVQTESGRKLGKVTRLFSTPAHDIMVVAEAGHEYMIPVKGDIIKKVDEQDAIITVAPPAGLLEINK